MAKSKGGDKGGDKKAAAGGKGKGGKDEKKEVKGAQSINVRHILVRFSSSFPLPASGFVWKGVLTGG